VIARTVFHNNCKAAQGKYRTRFFSQPEAESIIYGARMRASCLIDGQERDDSFIKTSIHQMGITLRVLLALETSFLRLIECVAEHASVKGFFFT
jgi:hypothetical protein